MDLLSPSDVPAHFDWRSIGGASFAIANWNQFVPEYCGSCWAHAAAAALSDRIKRLRNATWPDIEISRQVLLNCLDDEYDHCCSCNGGDPYLAYKYIHKSGIPDETCAAYVAADQVCTPAHICKGLDGQARADFKKYWVSEFGAYRCGEATTRPLDMHWEDRRCEETHGPGSIARMEWAMRSEIFKRGPIACCVAVTDTFEALVDHEVFVEPTARHDCDHLVSVSGWGETANGQKYWIARNSFGSYWGDGGWFRIARGLNNAGIEQYCAWGVPRDDWNTHGAAGAASSPKDLLV